MGILSVILCDDLDHWRTSPDDEETFTVLCSCIDSVRDAHIKADLIEKLTEKQLNNCLKIIDEDVINESEDISFVEEEKNSTEPVNEIKYVPQSPIILKRENHYSSGHNVF